LNAIVYSLPGYLKLLYGEWASAAELYGRMYKMDPDSPIFKWFFAWSLIYAKRIEDAYGIIDQLNTSLPSTIFASYGSLFRNALSGNKKDALEIITPEMKSIAKGVEFHSRALAEAYAILGEKEKAIDWLINSVNCGFINYPFYSEIDPLLENIRGEERFKKLMERVKYEWENFEV
jgi:predicted Zn-dependent protease